MTFRLLLLINAKHNFCAFRINKGLAVLPFTQTEHTG